MPFEPPILEELCGQQQFSSVHVNFCRAADVAALTARGWLHRIGYQYQWSSCAAGRCVDIQGATGRTYRVLLGDVGSRLRLVVTARNRAGKAVAVSHATALVLPAVPIPRTPVPSLP